jgi:hypothetical protein
MLGFFLDCSSTGKESRVWWTGPVRGSRCTELSSECVCVFVCISGSCSSAIGWRVGVSWIISLCCGYREGV